MNDNKWSILRGDSLRLLKSFECNTFDAIICDPHMLLVGVPKRKR